MANVSGGQVLWKIDADSGQFNAALDNSSRKAKDLSETLAKSGSKGFGNFSQNASNAFGSIANGLENVVKKTALVVAGSGGIGTAFLKSAADLQQTSKSFEVLTGNAEVANKLFAQLADFANKTPFEFPDIAKAGKTLLGFGISSNKVFGDVQVLGDIAAATGADFGSLATVFGQVNATGRLMGQDALQLINNNIPITTILAKKLGTSVQDVKQQMEDGAISADLFNQALLEQTSKGGFAFKGTEVLAQSLNGRLSTLKDTVLEFGRNLLGVKVDKKLGLVIEPGGIFDRFSNAIPKITKNLEDLAPKVKAGFDFLVRNGDTIKALLAAITVAFIAAKLAAIGFAIAAAANPFTLIAAAIVLLIGGLVFLYVRFQVVRDVIGTIFNFVKNNWPLLLVLLTGPIGLAVALIIKNFNTVKGFISSVFNFVKNNWPLLLAIITGPIGLAVLAVIKHFDKIKNGVGSVITFFKNLPGVIVNAMGNLGNVLTNAGKDLIRGLLSGAGSLLKDIGKFMAERLPRAIQGPFKRALGISSPSKVFAGYGANITQGLVQGIQSSQSLLNGAMSGLSTDIAGPTISPSVIDASPSGGATASSASGNVVVNLNMSGVMTRSQSDLRDVAKQMMEALNQELRARRVPEIGNGMIR